MPLIKRVVEPSSLCRQAIPSNVPNELECVTNNALSNVILQLSSLSVHAEDTFGELFNQANLFYARANGLQERIDRLANQTTQLDSSIEEVSLHDINKQQAFKSSVKIDQQVMSRDSLLDVIKRKYLTADAPPPLHQLNHFRDDGKDALKIYTDPDYFFNLWREAMTKEVRDAKEKRREQRRRDRKSEKNPDYRTERKITVAVPRKKLRAKDMELGEEFVGSRSKIRSQSGRSSKRALSKSPSTMSSLVNHNKQNTQSSLTPKYNDHKGVELAYPSLAETPIQGSICYEPPPLYSDLPEPPPPPPIDYYEEPIGIQSAPDDPALPSYNAASSSVAHYQRSSTPPTILPPPPPLPHNEQLPPPPPPPPPAPPEPQFSDDDDLSSLSGYQNEMARQLASVQLKKVESRSTPTLDTRSELLQAIRVGFQLKKVESQEKSSASLVGSNDVASILARRIAFVDDDSETDSYYSDDSDWDN